MFIPAFIQLIIITLTTYSAFFIWQLWKQISFNGELERSPPNLAVPSISWTLAEHQAQCNPGYEEEDDSNVQIDESLHVQENINIPRIEEQRTGEDVSPTGKSNFEILKEFECPVCFNLMLPPLQIFQCSLGHALCSSCQARGITVCPQCRKLIIGRAHHMENIARLLFENLK